MSKSKILSVPGAEHAIREAVQHCRTTNSVDRRYDGHDVINWLNDFRNAQLNDIIDCYGGRVHSATGQIGKFLKHQLEQTKIEERISDRRVTLWDGSQRNGKCRVSVWQC